MRIEIINTGTELLLGSTLNTHGAWMGQELCRAGLRVQRQITVPDGDFISTEMELARQHADVVIVTGGLGPTSDDLTKECLADILGLEMIQDEFALRTLEAFFEKRGIPMVQANLRQANAPIGADILPNPNGTAPGIYMPPRQGDGCAFFLLPGPPRELQPMFHAEVLPRLKALSGVQDPPLLVELKYVGIGESELQERVDHLLEAIDGLEHGYCARMGECDVRLIGDDAAVAAGRRVMAQHCAENFISDDGSGLVESLVARLTIKDLRIATAESCTGGLIASRITDVSGASAVLTHGFVTYGNEAKQQLLGVSAGDLELYGAVSEPVARQMADGALAASGADIAVSVTGIAGPTGGSDEKPVGTVFIGIARKGMPTEVLHQCHPRPRQHFKMAVSQVVLSTVFRMLAG